MIASLSDEAPAGAETTPKIERILLARLRPSPTQPRHLFRPEKLKEMQDSMRVHGWLPEHPALARPWPQRYGAAPADALELVLGERRYRGAKASGVAQAWVVVQELSDAQVIERQLIENLQRDDLTDIEEAEGYHRMLELRDEASGELFYKSLEALAARLGRAKTTIKEQLTLLNLGPAERQEVESGRLKKQTAYLIARQPTAELREIAAKAIIWPKHEEGPLSYRRAVQEIEKLSKDLRRAPFDRNDASLVPIQVGSKKDELRPERIGGGACADCPMAFVTEARSLCMNPACFELKVVAEWERWAEDICRAALACGKSLRVLSREECANLYKSDNQLVPAAGYVDLAEHPDGNDLRPGESDPGTWRALIDGSQIEVAVVRDRMGRARELVKREVALMAAAQNGHAEKFRNGKAESGNGDRRPSRRELGLAVPNELAAEADSSLESTQEQWLNAPASPEEVSAGKKKKEQEKATARLLDERALAVTIAEIDAVIQDGADLWRIEEICVNPRMMTAFLRLIVERELDYEAPQADLLKKYSLPIGGSVAKQIAKWSAGQLVVFLTELFVTEGGFQTDVHEEDQKWLKAIFGVDYRAVRKQAEKKLPDESGKQESRKGDSNLKAPPEKGVAMCTRTHCKRPAEDGFKMCAECRESVKLNQRQKRAEGRA